MALDDDDSLASSIAAAIAYSHAGTWTHLPGKVETYDAATQTASISLMVMDVEPTRALPILPSVPVVTRRGGGLYASFPCPPGTYGVVSFMILSMDQWRATGQVRPPTDGRRNSITSAVFEAGLSIASASLPSTDSAHIVLAREGSTPVPPSLSTLVDDELRRIADDFSRLVAAVSTALGGVPTTGGALKTAFDTAVGSLSAPPLTVPSNPGDTAAEDVLVS